MANRLKNIVIDRVDLCKRGSNPEAHITLFKSDNRVIVVPFGKAMTTLQILAYRKAWDDFYDLRDAFMSSIYGIMDSGADAKLLTQTVKEFAEANKEIMGTLEAGMAKSDDAVTFGALIKQLEQAVVKSPASSLVADIQELFGKFENQKGVPAMKIKIDKAKLDADTRSALEGYEKEVETLQKSFDDQKTLIAELQKQIAGAPAPTSIEDIKKGMTAGQLAAFDLLQKQASDAAEEIKKNAAITKAEVEKRRILEFTKTAETTMKFVPGMEIAALAKLLATAEDKLEKADSDALTKTLQTASEAIGKSELFKESGHGGGNGSGNGKSGIQKAKARAEEIRKAEPKLTEAQAITKAYAENPAWYNEE